MFRGQEILTVSKIIKCLKSSERAVCSHLEAAICKGIIHRLKMFSSPRQLFGWTHTAHSSKPEGGPLSARAPEPLTLVGTPPALLCFPQAHATVPARLPGRQRSPSPTTPSPGDML